METASIFSVDFSSPSIFVALAVTALCFVFAPIAVLLKSKSDDRGGSSLTKACNCVCSCSDTVATATKMAAVAAAESYLNAGSEGGGGEILEMASPAAVAVAAAGERQTGASMMEQLVPEITTHALSYLDYPSLCRLSMTNSMMRKAANDDNAWKALYHKDFTLEQDNIRPVNGWKAYYAATRAIVDVNAGFFNIIRERSLQAMGRLWLNADYVKCIHATGELFKGYNAVMERWQLAFNWEQGVNFQVREVKARVLTDMAWVSMKTYVDMEAGPFNVTNVFECHNGRWYMVHHHSSVILIDGEGQQQIVQG